MKRLIILIAFILFNSCTKKEVIGLYVFETRINDVIINGNNLKDFFVENDRMKIHKKTVEISSDLFEEFENVIRKFIEKKNIDSLGIGIYYYAIIHKKDTLYSSTGFKTWKYKNKVMFYDSSEFGEELSEYIK